MRDLLGSPEEEWQGECRRVAREGWGARLLAEQESAGRWGGGLYTPKWISTHYTLLLLHSLGLPADNPQAVRGARLLLDGGLHPDGGIHYSKGRTNSEVCETGMALAICARFLPEDERLGSLVANLLRVQLPDGGWNCQWVRGSQHGSFHSSISVLEGLHEYAVGPGGQAPGVLEAQARGREFLLQHRLFRSHRSGNIVDGAMTRFSFPYHWHYDVMRGLDYFQACRAPHDSRLDDAIALLSKRRTPDGGWLLQNRHPGRLWFEMETPSEPSRWNTLRALRVLRWWQA